MPKHEKQKLNRYERLLEIDQLRLDTVCEKLRIANKGVAQAEGAVLAAKEEKEVVIREADRISDIHNRLPTNVWLEWSDRQLKSLEADRTRLENERLQTLAEYHYWNKRVKGWETLIEKLGLAISKSEFRSDQAMADEFAIRPKK